MSQSLKLTNVVSKAMDGDLYDNFNNNIGLELGSNKSDDEDKRGNILTEW